MFGFGRWFVGIVPGAAAAALVIAAAPPTAAAEDSSGGNIQALVGAYNASGQSLYRRMATEPGNIVFSPYSVGSAMAMALAGARADTEREMLTVLKHRLPRPEIDAANARLLAALNGYDKTAVTPDCPTGMQFRNGRCESPRGPNGRCPMLASPQDRICIATPTRPPSARLLVANALMLANGDISPSYVALIKADYGAEVFERARLDDVNRWVSRKTDGKIEKLIERMSDLMLVNAVYFKSRWGSVFDARQTKDEPFHLSRANAVPVAMMQQRSNYAVVSRPGYRAIRLPYVIRALGMVVVLPDEPDGLAGVAGALDADALSVLFSALHEEAPRPVVLALPRFKSELKVDLMTLFQEAGMARPFDLARADFSGLTGTPPAQAPAAIDQIVHRAVIEVAEESTEAAAATGVGVALTSVVRPQPEPIVFRVDRPFLYYLVDDATGAILFQGRVVDPR